MFIFILNLYVVVAAFSAISYVTPKVIPQYDFNSQILDHNEVSLPSYEENEEQCVPNCESKIFCYGDILKEIQTRKIQISTDTGKYDGKTFVDLKLKNPEEQILKAYEELTKNNRTLPVEDLKKFLDQYFELFNMTRYKHTPDDFTKNPPVAGKITDPNYRNFSIDLNNLWLYLSFKWDKEMDDNTTLYSTIYVPNTFIVASAERFREMYYWDSYWIIRGLLVCGMESTTRGIIENMIYIVKKYGYMPNGARIYYLRRSQPPLLIRMASTYYDSTKNESFIKNNLEYFEKEFQFWMKNRSVEVFKGNQSYTMYRYNAYSCTPRPESYEEDFTNALNMTEIDRRHFYTGVKSAAESGWDFSSRFIRGNYGERSDDLKREDAQNFIPVDLNSMLQYNAQILSEWFEKYNDLTKAEKYKTIAKNLNEAIQKVLWNDDVGCWLDWDIKEKKSRYFFYPSNLTPLWTNSYDKKNKRTVERVIGYLGDVGLLDTKMKATYWGVPTSVDMYNSSQQWDYPNTWAPLQSLVIDGLRNTDHPKAQEIASELAAKFVKTTYECFINNNKTMHEKYDATSMGRSGAGGEYAAQIGFGWTNGFVLELLDIYGHNLTSKVDQIFCDGEILHDVQTRRIYEDSKDFVDSKLKFTEAEVIQKYADLKKQYGQLTDDQMRQFLNQNFYNPSDMQNMGLDNWSPPDYRNNPSIVENIRDAAYKKFALSLNARWIELAAKVSKDVQDNPDRYSLIYLPNGFIKAGGRFREMYYWDSYWVIRGLLLCDMYETVRGIIENIIHMVHLYGHMPNGSRKYYLQRSQPPLLIQMAACYHSVTKDDDFIKNNLQNFETEFEFWFTKRMVNVTKDGRVYRMARYNAVSCSPRPESYRDDYNNSRQLPQSERKRFFTGIKSGAESGWDFSSRHIRAPDDSNNASLLYIETQSFIYVDLNCILHANAVVLSEWFKYFGNEVMANKYKTIADNLQEAIDNVLWNEEVGMWLDWDLKATKSRNYFYPSNLTPLWTSSYNKYKIGLVEKVITYLLKNGIIRLDLSTPYWAIPTSLKMTGEQWDFPNGWAPLQAIVIQGLERTGHPMARYVAFNMAQNWIRTTYAGFQTNGTMFEKYSAVTKGSSGGGGEYVVQNGFGWTNGFCLEVFNTWGRFLNSMETS